MQEWHEITIINDTICFISLCAKLLANCLLQLAECAIFSFCNPQLFSLCSKGGLDLQSGRIRTRALKSWVSCSIEDISIPLGLESGGEEL